LVRRLLAMVVVVSATAVGSPSGTPAPPIEQACSPCMTGVAAAIRGRFQESRFDGTLTVSGRLEDTAALLVRLLTVRHEHWRRQLSFSVSPGPFEFTIPMRRDFRPGSYTVEVRADNSFWTHEPPNGGCLRAGGPTEVGFECYALPQTAPPPPEGYVNRAYASRSRSGPAVRRMPAGTKQAWVRFEFLPNSLPRRGSGLSVSWRAPNGRQTPGSIQRPRTFIVLSFVRSPRSLVGGTWQVALRADGVTVKRLSFVVR
jgi:hypothetical protein